jgi:hypothetical protein
VRARGRDGIGAFVGAVALAAALPAAAAADWLVLADGSRLETKGTWETRGAMVVFHLPNGTMSSLRASQVDLDASAALTRRIAEEAARPKPTATPAPKRAPVAVLTDADFTQVTDVSADVNNAPVETSAPAEGDGSTAAAALATDGGVAGGPAGDIDVTPAGGEADTSAGSASEGDTGEGNTGAASGEGAADPAASAEPDVAPAERLRIVGAHDDLQSVSAGTLAIVGDLHNVSSEMALGIKLKVQIYDDEGVMIGEADAMLGATSLNPNQRTNFRATFPGLTRYARVEFQPQHVAVETSGSREP